MVLGGACTQDDRDDVARRPGNAIDRAQRTAFCAALRNNADRQGGDLARAVLAEAPSDVRADLQAYADSGDAGARERAKAYAAQHCGAGAGAGL